MLTLNFVDNEGNHLYTSPKFKIYLKVYYSSEVKRLGEFRNEDGILVYNFFYPVEFSEDLKIPLNLKIIQEIPTNTILSTVIGDERFFIDRESALKFGELGGIVSTGLDVIFYTKISFWTTDVSPLDLKKVSEDNRVENEIDDFVYFNC